MDSIDFTLITSKVFPSARLRIRVDSAKLAQISSDSGTQRPTRLPAHVLYRRKELYALLTSMGNVEETEGQRTQTNQSPMSSWRRTSR